MNVRRKTSLIIFLCFQALAVTIICCGSLINFHQYKIWGKPLIPNFVGYKRDIEKYSKTLSLSKYSAGNNHLQKDSHGNDFAYVLENLLLKSTGSSLLTSDFSQKAPVNSRISSTGLRGPPVS